MMNSSLRFHRYSLSAAVAGMACVAALAWCFPAKSRAIEIFRVYEMGENDPDALIGDSNFATEDSQADPDPPIAADIAGEFVALDNTNGALYVEGRTGPGSFAIDFNGEVLRSAPFDPRNDAGQSFTAFSQAWLKPDFESEGFQQVVWQLGAELGTLKITGDGFWEMEINGGGGGPGFVTTDVPVVFDDWTHVAILRTGGGGRLYVNGSIAASTTNFWNGPGSEVTLGGPIIGLDFYDGVIDDFEIGSGADGSFDVATDINFWDDTDFSGVLGDVDPSQDGLVNDLDYQTWSDNAGFDNGFGFGDPGTLVRGDVDQNGRVNYFDFQIIFEQAAAAGTPLSVNIPEPSTVTLLLGGVALFALRRSNTRRLGIATLVMMGTLALATHSSAQVIIAEDFFYNQPTKAVGDNSGFPNQDYAGGQNSVLGNWVGRWGAVGDANITGSDHPEASEQFQGRTRDQFDATNLNRDYVLTGVAPDQTLYFGASIRNPAEDDTNDPMPRMVLNFPAAAEDLTEISMGFEAGSFAAILGDQVTVGTETTVDQSFHRLVGKLEINAAGANERLTVWLDPTDVETGVESVSVEADVITGLDAPEFTGLLVLENAVGTFGANSAWFDDIAVATTWEGAATVDIPRVTLQVSTLDGAARLLNETGFDFDLNFIEVLSESGSLETAGSQVVAAGWQENNPSETALTQTNFGGGSTLADGGHYSLGAIFDLAGTEDLVARVGTDLGLLNLAAVEFGAFDFSSGTSGDFNGDGVVDGADFLQYQREFPNLTLADWEGNFGALTGVEGAAAVPEPATLLLAGIVVGLGLLKRRS